MELAAISSIIILAIIVAILSIVIAMGIRLMRKRSPDGQHPPTSRRSET